MSIEEVTPNSVVWWPKAKWPSLIVAGLLTFLFLHKVGISFSKSLLSTIGAYAAVVFIPFLLKAYAKQHVDKVFPFKFTGQAKRKELLLAVASGAFIVVLIVTGDLMELNDAYQQVQNAIKQTEQNGASANVGGAFLALVGGLIKADEGDFGWGVDRATELQQMNQSLQSQLEQLYGYRQQISQAYGKAMFSWLVSGLTLLGAGGFGGFIYYREWRKKRQTPPPLPNAVVG